MLRETPRAQSSTAQRDESTVFGGDTPTVQPPPPPGDPEAWYTPDVVAQYAVRPGIVATVRDVRDSDASETDTDTASSMAAPFSYETREPSLCADGERAFERIREHFDAGQHRRPLTRAGVVERAREGFEPKYDRAVDRLVDASNALRRRLDYHALRAFRLLGEVTPLALDDRIRVADAADPGAELVVHTETFSPAATGLSPDDEFTERVAAERLREYTVSFVGFEVPVVVYRDHLLGEDSFTTRYAVREPPLLPGDEALVAECKDRIWEADVSGVVEDRYDFVGDRARQFLSRRLTARNTRAYVDAASYRLRSALAEHGVAVPPVDSQYARDRLDDLVYYVLRDFVGEGILTVPLRDGHLEDVEANRVGERVKVVPREAVLEPSVAPDPVADRNAHPHGTGRDSADAHPHGTGRDSADAHPHGTGQGSAGHSRQSRDPSTVGRVPTNLQFDDESQFVNVVTQLAAQDGTELNASTPSAKVNLDLAGVESTVRCAVALPVVSEGGPHLSVRKQAPETMTPVDLLQRDAISTELVALLWLLYEHHGVVLFSGPTGVGKTTLLNAHMPFVPFDDRPISIDEGSREVRLPHETGVSLTTRDHEQSYKRVSMADLMTEANYLNPDVEVIAEINSPASFRTFGESLNTGHGLLGTTHAEDVTTLVNRVIEQGLPAYLLGEIDLVVFPRQVDGDRYVGQAVELGVGETVFADCDGRGGVVEKDGSHVGWNRVAGRTPAGSFSFASDHRVFARIAASTDRAVDAVESEFCQKHRYVQYLQREEVTDFRETFEFLADLRADEPATVERVRRAAETTDETRGAADD